jgi:hypothetical protein
MSRLGHFQTWARELRKSALPQETDIVGAFGIVVFMKRLAHRNKWHGYSNTRRGYFSFSQTKVTTLILPSPAKGAGRAT